MNGLIGRKIGMTQVFDEEGRQVPVTVIEAGPCVVIQRKTRDRDGYEAAQLGFGKQKEQRLSKPKRGHVNKAKAEPVTVLREVRLEEGEEINPGDVIRVDILKDATHVDVLGICKGRGFQGVVRRYGMSGGRASQGSGMHRRTGAIGMKVSPARVFKGTRMPGHMGHVHTTTQNLRIVEIREEDNAVLVQGAVPGPNGGLVVIRKAIKKPLKQS